MCLLTLYKAPPHQERVRVRDRAERNQLQRCTWSELGIKMAMVYRDNINNAEWWTAKEAAAYVKVGTRTLLLWVRQGKIRGYPLSGIKRRVWRFRKADLDAALLG